MTALSLDREHRLSVTGGKLGLLAGSGRFPIVFAESAKRDGWDVHCVGIRGEAPEVLDELCHSFIRRSVVQLGGIIRAFRDRGVQQIVMAGKVHKHVMYDPLILLRMLLDRRTCQFWYRRLADRKDDSILLGVIDEFARDGMTFTSALDYCPDLLAPAGVLTRRQPTGSQREDIAFGWELAKEMGRLDVGQSVAVRDRAVIAVEAIEGTDRCIERAGHYCKSGGWTLVKVAKPQQDMRFDVPTVGPATIESLHRAKAKVLAIEAGRTILIDRQETIALADRYGIAICSRTPEDE